MKLAPILRDLLRQSGYSLRRRGFPMRSYSECFAAMQRLGVDPKTVFDVGVAQGTPELYRSFPAAHHVLIEPLSEYDAHMVELRKRYRMTSIAAAAGAEPGTAKITVGRDPRKSSVVRDVLRGSASSTREVPVVTIDDIRREHRLEPPYLIKIDVEGAELSVVAGARDTLSKTLALVLETSLWDPENKVPELSEVVATMRGHGFVVYDFIGAALHSGNGGLRHVDLVFVAEDGPLRPTIASTT